MPDVITSDGSIRQDDWVVVPRPADGESLDVPEQPALIPADLWLAGKEHFEDRDDIGVWLDSDREQNEIELNNAIAIANAGNADILGVGNEVLLRGDLSEDELIEYIERAKQGAPGVETGYVDAYFEFEAHPRITAACDLILANCYPFWEGCPAEHALLYMKEMYRRAEQAGNRDRAS